jgi:hypothetical protein
MPVAAWCLIHRGRDCSGAVRCTHETWSVVLYKPIMYGDMIENFSIVMMLSVPVIVAVAFRVGLDSWLDAE